MTPVALGLGQEPVAGYARPTSRTGTARAGPADGAYREPRRAKDPGAATSKLFGMKAAPLDPFGDGIVATAIERQNEPPQLAGDLLLCAVPRAELSEKQARAPGSPRDLDRVEWRMKYQLAAAELPFAPKSQGGDRRVRLRRYTDPISRSGEPLVRHLAAGGCLAQQRNLVLSSGLGQPHPMPAGRHGDFGRYNVEYKRHGFPSTGSPPRRTGLPLLS